MSSWDVGFVVSSCRGRGGGRGRFEEVIPLKTMAFCSKQLLTSRSEYGWLVGGTLPFYPASSPTRPLHLFRNISWRPYSLAVPTAISTSRYMDN